MTGSVRTQRWNPQEIAVTSLLAALLCASAAYAQSPGVAGSVAAQGFHEERNYFSPEPWEHVDTLTGNVILTFTDLTLPGNAGRSLQFQRVFNNQLGGTCGSAVFGNGNSTPTSRWSFGFPGMVMRIVESAHTPPSASFNYQDNLEWMMWDTPVFVMADGGVRCTLFETRPLAGDSATAIESRRMVRSAQFYRYDRSSRLLYMPDGTLCQYSMSGLLEWFEDPYGNRVTLDRSNANAVVVTQDLGGQSRAVTLTIDSQGRTERMEYEGRIWQYDYVDTGYQFRDIELVTLPMGTHWTFSYEPTNLKPVHDLKSLITPTGGRVQYTYVDFFISYSPFGDPAAGGEWARALRDRNSDDVSGSVQPGTWTIDAGYGTAGIVTPSGTRVTYEYYGINTISSQVGRLLDGVALLSKRTVQSISTGVELERETRSYQVVPTVVFNTDGPVWWFGTPEILTRTITRDGQPYTTTYSYNMNVTYGNFGNYHHPGSIVESGNGPTRTTGLNYRHFTTLPLFRVGLPTDVTTTVDTEAFVKSWFHDNIGFELYENNGGLITYFTRDGAGNVTSVRTPAGHVTNYLYSWGQVSEIRTALHTTTRNINTDGTVDTETRGIRITRYEHDTFGRLRKVRPPGDTNPIATDYNDAIPATVTVSRGSTGGPTSVVTTTLDGFGRPIETVNSVGIQTRTAYDAEGRVIREGLPFTGTSDIWTAITYDGLGRVLSRTHPGGATVTRTYGAGSVTILDENLRDTLQTWNAVGHPDDARLVGVRDANQQAWVYNYNAVGSLREVISSDGIVREWEYNAANQVITETHPESGTTRYEYLAQLLSKKTDQQNNVSTYAYDQNGRLWRTVVGGKTTTIQYAPDTDLRELVTAPNSSTTLVYDTPGHLQERKDVIGAYVFFSRYQYDNNDNVTKITYPSSREVQYEYDSERRIIHVFEPQAGREHAFGMTYHPSGALATYTTGNLIPTMLTYDPNRYWVSSISVGSLKQLTYSNYDGVGNVGQIVDSQPGGLTQSFTYDALDRLETVAGPQPGAYAYDVHGNRTNIGTNTYTYEAGTLRLSNQNGVAYTYDGNGNLRTAGGNTFTYTPENWLASAAVAGGTITYAYDSEGWRTRTSAPGDNTFYVRGLSNEVLSEWHYTPTATRARDYIYAGSRLISAVDRVIPLPTGCGGETRPDGTPNPITINTPAGSASVTFEGSGCRRVSVLVTKTSGTLGCLTIEIRVVATNSLVGTPAGNCGNPVFYEPVTLPVGGDYQVIVRAGSGTGAANVQIYDVVDVMTPITSDGLPVQAELLTPGQNTRLPFTGLANQRMSVLVNVMSGGFGCWAIEIWRVSTNTRISPAYSTCASTGPGFLEPVTLPANDQYEVVVNPSMHNTGTAAVHLYDVVDLTTPITANGTPLSIDLTVPGRKTWLPFTGTAQQRVSVYVTVNTGTFGCVAVEIWSSATNTRVSPAYSTCSGSYYAFLEPFALPADGEYRVVVDPNMSNTGTGMVRLYTVVDVTGSVALGTPIAVNLPTPGQQAQYSFNAVTGQRISVAATLNGMPACWWLRVFKPDGSPFGNPLGPCGTSTFFEPLLISAPGTYKVVIDPNREGAGSGTLAVYDVVDVSSSITPNGGTTPLALPTPGQVGRLSFSGIAGHKATIAVSMTSGSFGCWVLTLLKPDLSTLSTWSQCATNVTRGPTTLSSPGGTFTIVVDPGLANTGTANITLTDTP